MTAIDTSTPPSADSADLPATPGDTGDTGNDSVTPDSAAASTAAPFEAAPETAADAAPAPAANAAAPEAAAMSPAACAEKLRELFPALFSGPAKPIKLRIQADIQTRAPGLFTKALLSGFLRRYTGSTSYLIALTRAPQRIDLDGQPAGEISEEHRQAAADELARRRQVHESRRQAEEDQRRDRAQLLRAFETTTLTQDNFCALKGITPEALEATLAQARQEAQERPAGPAFGGRPDRPHQNRGAHDRGPRPQGDGHPGPGPRRDAGGPAGQGRPRREGGGEHGGRDGRSGPRGGAQDGQGRPGPNGPRRPRQG